MKRHLRGVKLDAPVRWPKLIPFIEDTAAVIDGIAGDLHRFSYMLQTLFQNDRAFQGAFQACEENDAVLQRVMSDMFRLQLIGDAETREIDWLYYRMNYRACAGFVNFVILLKEAHEKTNVLRAQNAPPDPEEGATIFGGG